MPSIVINNTAAGHLKWLALVLMTLDHYNKYMLHGTSTIMFAAGRVVFPVFSIVLAWNLANADDKAMGRTIGRLLVFGLISMPASSLLGAVVFDFWPLNVLFTLLITAWVIRLLNADRPIAAGLVFVCFGWLVEFWWPGIAIGVCAWLYARSPTWQALGGLVLAFFGLSWVNGSHWALLAPVVIAAVAVLGPRLPQPKRLKWAFYAYYPLHLYLLFVLVTLQGTQRN